MTVWNKTTRQFAIRASTARRVDALAEASQVDRSEVYRTLLRTLADGDRTPLEPHARRVVDGVPDEVWEAVRDEASVRGMNIDALLDEHINASLDTLRVAS